MRDMMFKGKKIDWNEESMTRHRMMHGWMILIAGVLIMANAYWMILSWPMFIGLIAAIAGLKKLLMPGKCCH